MKIILFSRPQVAHSPEKLCQLFDMMARYGFDYEVNSEFADFVRQTTNIPISQAQCYQDLIDANSNADIMVCYGGDGTLLEGVHRLNGLPIPVMGINAGHLGFLTSSAGGGFEEVFEQIHEGKIKVEPRSVLRVEGTIEGQPQELLALNEFAVQRHGPGLISVETYVNDQMVATYHGDGVIVSTPTGSTAYSLSAGGPVVVPTCQCFVISPLAPHNLTMRPVVIPDSAEIRLKLKTRHSSAYVMLDNRTYSVASDTLFRITRSKQQILLAVPHNISFYDTLRNKMMWGIDIRS